MVPEVCNLHLVLAVALLTHKSVTTFGCWFVCTSKQEILLIRAEAFIMVIVCGTVKFGTSYRGESFLLMITTKYFSYTVNKRYTLRDCCYESTHPTRCRELGEETKNWSGKTFRTL